MSQAEEHIPINVWLAGRSYRIRILPQEEEAVRLAAKRADEKIAELRQHYAGRDDQDFVAMCLLMYSADHAAEMQHHPVLQDEISRMVQRIDEALKTDTPQVPDPGPATTGG